MGCEWDDNKRRRNLDKHGIDFPVAATVFDGRPVVTYFSPRQDEDRWATVGGIDGRLIVVVWTKRGGNYRIISARRARKSDERAYRAVHG